VGIELHRLANWRMIERRLDPQCRELVDHDAAGGPVLQPLEVNVEAMSHLRGPLVDDDPTSRAVRRQRRGEPRWTGPQHMDWRAIGPERVPHQALIARNVNNRMS